MKQNESTAGIILAAGMSERFGRSKQLAEFNGKYLIEHVLDAALASKLGKVILVLGFHHESILSALNGKRQSRLEIVLNPDYRQGQSTSLRAGLEHVADRFDAVMFMVADQPMLNAKTIDFLLDAYRRSGKDVCVPIFRGERGNPAIFGRDMFVELLGIRGDTGARMLIRSCPQRVFFAEIPDPLCLSDIDTESDLETLLLKSNEKKADS